VTVEGSVANAVTRSLWTAVPGPTAALSGAAPDRPGTIASGNAFARWTRSFDERTSLQVQSYADIMHRHDGNGVAVQDSAVDFDAEFHRLLPHGHDLVAGGGYRAGRITTDGNFIYSVSNHRIDTSVLNAFVQDDILIAAPLQMTLGSKFEHDFLAGWSMQPTARVIWTPAPAAGHLWGAVSRALRTPSTNDIGMRINFAAFTGDRGLPVVLGLVGNSGYHAERLLNIEGGYRVDVAAKLSTDVTVFHGRYSGLPTQEPMTPQFEAAPAPHLFIATQTSNLLDANSSGVEFAAYWTPLASWRFDAGYSALRISPHPDAASRDTTAANEDGNAPAQQWQLHASSWLTPRLELDGGVYSVGRLRVLNVPAYTRVDAQAQLKLSQPLSLAITGQNLLDGGHLEFANGNTGLTATSIPRSAGARLIWTF
jgi:iron complex outermembrane receptor protein